MAVSPRQLGLLIVIGALVLPDPRFSERASVAGANAGVSAGPTGLTSGPCRGRESGVNVGWFCRRPPVLKTGLGVRYDDFPIAFCSSASGTLRPCNGRIWSTTRLSRSMLSYRFTWAGLGCAG